MSRFYLDRTTTVNTHDILSEDFRETKQFADYTKAIYRAITKRPGVTIRALLDVPCPHRDLRYWLNLALHELKSAGKISERGVLFSRFFTREGK